MELLRRIGLFTSMQGYRRSWLTQDMLAAVMLLAIALPGQIATAHLAGMPPQAGLYAFLAGTVAFAVFGSNRFAVVAADSTIAPIFAGLVAVMAGISSARYGDLLMVLSLMVGAVLIIVGLLKASWIADLLSIPVTVGFFSGIAVHIVVAQLPDIFGVPGGSGHVLFQLYAALRQLPEMSPWAVGISLFMLTAAFGMGYINRKVPAALIGLALVSLATWLFDFPARYGLAVLGALDVRLPHLTFPDVELVDVARLFPLSLSIALICIMQAGAVLRTYPSSPDQPEDIAKDFAAAGIGNVMAGLIGAFPINTSPPSTATVVDAGGKTQACSLFAAAMILALILFAGPLLAYVPRAALGAILVVVASRIVNVPDLLALARGRGLEFILAIVSMLLVVLLPIETGVMLSIILSLIHSAYTIARPVCAELVRLPGSTIWWPPEASDREEGERVASVLAFAPAAPINFTNANYICKRLMAVIEGRKPDAIRFIVIDASGVASLDFTGARILSDCINLLRRRGMAVALARLSSPRAGREARATGFLEVLGEAMIFHSVEDAVRSFQSGADHHANP